MQIAMPLYSDRWIFFHNFILCFWEILRSINVIQVIIHMMYCTDLLAKHCNYPGRGNSSQDSCSSDLAAKEWEMSWTLPDPFCSEEWLLGHHAGLPWFQDKCESKPKREEVLSIDTTKCWLNWSSKKSIIPQIMSSIT